MQIELGQCMGNIFLMDNGQNFNFLEIFSTGKGVFPIARFLGIKYLPFSCAASAPFTLAK